MFVLMANWSTGGEQLAVFVSNFSSHIYHVAFSKVFRNIFDYSCI